MLLAVYTIHILYICSHYIVSYMRNHTSSQRRRKSRSKLLESNIIITIENVNEIERLRDALENPRFNMKFNLDICKTTKITLTHTIKNTHIAARI